MCGLFGFYLNTPLSERDIALGKEGLRLLEHRGPDNTGYWYEKNDGVFLGHTRLAILDKSDENNQPFVSSRIRMVYNGELYNFREIKNELLGLGHHFRTRGDTEVVAKAWESFGENTLQKFDGMYAFAIYQNRDLFLATDIFGEKPLYWLQNSRGFYFSSEPKPLVHCLGLEFHLSEDDRASFISLGYVPSPNTAFRGLKRCEPASFLRVKRGQTPCIRKYYSPPEQFVGTGKVAAVTSKEIDQIQEALVASLANRTVSDVPKGLFLSSGVDSCLVAAMLKKDLREDIFTLTVSFDEKLIHDESRAAQCVAEYLHLPHVIVPSKDADNEISFEKLDDIYGEPNLGLTAFSVRQMSNLARPYFTVALSGTGGDEIFYGYGRHHFLYKNRKLLTSKMFKPALRSATNILPESFKRFKTLHYLLRGPNEEILFRLKNTPFFNDEQFSKYFSRACSLYFDNINSENIVLESRKFDLAINLPNVIIPSVERASMKESLEVRTPYLNRPLLEVVASMDYRKFVAFGQKYVLRRLLERYLPKHLFDLPKRGFVFPYKTLIGKAFNEIEKKSIANTEIMRVMRLYDHDGRWGRILLRLACLERYEIRFLKQQPEILPEMRI